MMSWFTVACLTGMAIIVGVHVHYQQYDYAVFLFMVFLIVLIMRQP